MNVYILCTVILTLVTIGICEERFVEEPQDSSVNKGSTKILDCKVAELVGQVQWTRDRFALGTAQDNGELQGYPRYTVVGDQASGEYNLMISNAQLEDDAVFQCQVGRTDTTPGLKSNNAKLNVNIPPDRPTIDGAPRVEVVVNTPVNLTCNANNAKPAANITWYVASIEATDDVFYTSGPQSAGKLEDAQLLMTYTAQRSDDGKELRCHAINQALLYPKVTTALLEVLYPPDVTLTVTPSKRVQEYGDVKFTCAADGNPGVITWKWFIGDDEQTETTNELTLSQISRDLHNKKVKCQASNSVGANSVTITLNIEFGPRFTSEPQHVAVDPGDEATLVCNVEGNPAPAIVWTKEDDPIILSTSSVYKIAEVRPLHYGVYHCSARVIGFDEVSMNIHLLQKGPPHIVSEVEQSARIGDQGKVECLIKAVPKPSSIEWVKNGEPLDVSVLERYSVRDEDTVDGKLSVVVIESVQSEDFGVYNCTAVNEKGTDGISIQFIKKDVIHLAYILGGVLAGVVILIVIIVILFICLRRRTHLSESGSESSDTQLAKRHNESGSETTSEDSIQKKNDLQDGVDYKPDPYGNPIYAWQTENFTNAKLYQANPAEYDELKYPNQSNGGPYDYGYGNRGYDKSNYGTYPGRALDHRYQPPEPPYGHLPPPPSVVSDYGTYGRAPRSDYGIPPAPQSDYGEFPPPPPSINSRLSTNV